MTHDIAEFAVESIRRWWRQMGQAVYRHARQLLITADCGGSNGSRVRLWKVQLQRLADELGLQIRLACVTFPLGRASGTRSNIAHVQEGSFRETAIKIPGYRLWENRYYW